MRCFSRQFRQRFLQRVCVLLLAVFLIPGRIAPAESRTPGTEWKRVSRLFARSMQEGDGRGSLAFSLEPELFRQLKADSSVLWYIAARAGFEQISWCYWSDGRVEVDAFTPYDCPYVQVATQEAWEEAIRSMREIQAERFVILPDAELYEAMLGDTRTHRLLLLRGGLRDLTNCATRDGVCSFQYEGCVYWDGPVREVTGERQTLEAMLEFGEAGYGAFALALDPETYEVLTANDMERLNCLEALAYIEKGVVMSETDHLLIFGDAQTNVFYPGYAILQAVKHEKTASLPPRLKETLQKALDMVGDLQGTEREIVLAIHDMLCEQVSYVMDPHSDEDDECIGALLSAGANCDGYADAFLLLCGLKGIPVHLMEGHSRTPDGGPHMWNLVRFDDAWRGVDVTWDDQDPVSYENYNMGLDRMREQYDSAYDLFVEPVLEATDPLDRPVPEFQAASLTDWMQAVRTALDRSATGALIRLEGQLLSDYRAQPMALWKWMDLSGIRAQARTWGDQGTVILSDMQALGEAIAACEAATETDFVQRLSQAGRAGISEIRIYCSDALFERYLESDNPVWKWLDLSGCQGSVAYSTEQRRVVVSGISLLDPGVLVVQADSESDIVSALVQAGRSGVSEVRVYCSSSLYALFAADPGRTRAWLNEGGVRSASILYSEPGRMLTMKDIQW